VGEEAFAQKTTAEAREYRFTASPLQQSLDYLIKLLSALVVAFCVLYVVIYFLQPQASSHDEKLQRERDLARAVAATVTSMVPQGLVPMATLAMILGAVRMASRGAIVQRLSAVESMAAVNVLCMDKTGTLTTNRLRLERVHALDDAPDAAVQARLRLFAWASADSSNKSILALRAALGGMDHEIQVLDQLPFKSQNRYSAVRVAHQQSELVLVLGACEALRPHVEGNSWEPVWKELLCTGLRLLLFAEASTPDVPAFHGTLDSFRLRPLGLVALRDELRAEASAVLRDLAGQGVTLKIISGDNPETVRATVGHLDLPFAREPVVSGDELAKAQDAASLIRSRGVFGRVAPQQKVQIVAALQEQGCHVAMIGDGVNDVLPIKKADLGIAMGEGSAASKTVSGLVLENNNFALLPALLDEGRNILRNLRRCGKLFLTKNVYSLMLIVGSLFGLPFPYVPQQVTLLNFLTIGIPAFLITLSKERSTVAMRPGFLRDIARFVLPTGIVLGIAGLVMLALAAHYEADEKTERTLLLSTLVLLGLGNILRALRHGESGSLHGDTRFRWLAAVGLPVYLLMMYLPPTGRFFELTPLTWMHWGMVFSIAAPAFVVCELSDRAQVRWYGSW
jgi:cation-transporting ATPase E